MEHNESNGSKWWKIDFHVHTPASDDYGKGDAQIKNHTTEEEILKSAIIAELDAIVIADHNSGNWIDKLKIKYNEIKTAAVKPEWFRELTIIPGVEITVANTGSRVHLLAVFDPTCDSDKITGVLGKCGITSGFGDDQKTSSPTSFEDIIKIIQDNNGIAIPAHIDKIKGLLHGKQTINDDLKRVLNNLSAAEFCDPNAFDSEHIELKKEVEKLAVLAGSDAHTPDEIGKHSSWIKMSNATKDELELALINKDFCVKNQEENPNIIPDIFIKSLEIKSMKYCGRKPDNPFKMNFHPHFNSIIGGRGSGKSTALESIRIASRRIDELKDIPAIKDNLDKFKSNSKAGVMLNETKLLLEINRNEKEYRLSWNADSTGNVLEEKIDNEWISQEPGNLQERFQLSIYSQKQINELSKNPEGLLEIIDRAAVVNRADLIEKWNQLKSKFMLLCEKRREIKRQLALEPEIQTKLNDVINDLKLYEEHGHGEILKNYQIKIQQLNFFSLEDDFDNLADKIMEIANDAAQNDFPELQFQEDSAIEEVKKVYNETASELSDAKSKLLALAEKVKSISTNRKNKIEQTDWYKSVVAAYQAYNSLIKEYEGKNSSIDLNVYSQWVQKRAQLQQEMNRIKSLQKEADNIQSEMGQTYQKFIDIRKELFKSRKKFIDDIISDTSLVKMELIPYGDTLNIETEFRNILGLATSTFQSSILDNEAKKGLLYELFNWEKSDINNDKLPKMIFNLKQKFISLTTETETNINTKFVNKLKIIKKEHPANFDNLLCWWPEDQLRVKYKQSGKYEDLEKGSAGQKAAAILAFLLSYDDKPLIIDQPEDDLDNALIYDLIVKQIQKSKDKRQLIIVTHNPNIVVNGDAELVHIMEFKDGQVQVVEQGGLGEKNIRNTICKIMEGGITAFKNRYKRITAGENYV